MLRASGVIYLTTVRICFVLSQPSATFAAFDIPLQGISGEAFKQPIFGANHLDVTVAPVPGRGLSVPTLVQLTFNEGGCNTFLRIFYELMGRVHAQREAGSGALAAPAVPAVLEEVHSAYVAASDPTVLYLVQPQQPQPQPQQGGWVLQPVGGQQQQQYPPR